MLHVSALYAIVAFLEQRTLQFTSHAIHGLKNQLPNFVIRTKIKIEMPSFAIHSKPVFNPTLCVGTWYLLYII